MSTQPQLDSIPSQFILPYSMWELIRPIYETQFGEMPAQTKAQIIVETINGEVTGFFALQHAIHAGPMYVYPSERNKGVAARLAQYMDEMFRGKGVTVFIVTENEQIKHLARELELDEVAGSVFAKEIE